MSKLIGPRQLAVKLNTSESAIYQKRHRGELPPAIKIDSRVLWVEEEVDEWIASHRERRHDAPSAA
jgi:predicted DNA-binding transcriptional regulator AlpA